MQAVSTAAMASNVDKADKAIQEYNKDSILPNAIKGNLGFLPSVQAVNAAKSQFVSDIMGKLRGAGRVTQQEVQYASDAYPGPTQAESVQKQNIQYLRDLTDTVQKRQAYEYNAINDGLTPPAAKMAALQKFPIPPPANFTPSSGSTPPAAGATSPTVTPATPAQGSYQIKATTPEEIHAEAVKAKAAGYKSITLPDGSEHVLTNGE